MAVMQYLSALPERLEDWQVLVQFGFDKFIRGHGVLQTPLGPASFCVRTHAQIGSAFDCYLTTNGKQGLWVLIAAVFIKLCSIQVTGFAASGSFMNCWSNVKV